MLRFLAESLKAMTDHSRLCHDAIQYQVPHTSSFKGGGDRPCQCLSRNGGRAPLPRMFQKDLPRFK